MTKVPFLAIGVIHRQIGMPPFWSSLTGTIGRLSSQGQLVTLLCAEGTTVAKQRNEIVARAMAMGASDLIFFDDDHLVSCEMVESLLAVDADVVGGLYLTRHEPFHTTAFHWHEDREKPCQSLSAEECDAAVPLAVDGVGMGCTRIRLSSLDGLEAPYFRLGQLRMDEMGEDIDFCRRLKALGRSVMVLPYVKVPHLTVRAVVQTAGGQVHLVEPKQAVAFAKAQRSMAGVV